MNLTCVTYVSHYPGLVHYYRNVSGAERERGGRKSGERERSAEREAAERERSGERVSQK